VGITYNLNNRLSQHWDGTGAKWTKLHKPLSVIMIEFPSSADRENELTEEFIKTYGKDKVKGGKYCK
jgi:predicted GIY-YIG superfamily endonuclease